MGNDWVFRPAVAAELTRSALGNTAGKVSAQKNQGFEDGRKKRFDVREIAQKSNPTGFERLGRCGKNPLPHREIELMHDKNNKRAYYSGVETCGNPWACPVCSAKIQTVRGQEIGVAVDKARSSGYKVTMLTFTHPHYKNQGLAGLIDRHNRAVKRFRQGRWFQNWKSSVGFIGSISSAEVTHGLNGWHWHTHVLYITRSDDWDDYALSVRWLDCLRAVGFDVNDSVMVHGLDVMRDCHASDYLTKMGMSSWGAEKELTASHRKEAWRGGRTPFQLLEVGDIEHWREYVIATRGRKQLIWSKGLKKWAGIGEVSDDEAAADEADEQVVSVAVVPVLVWWQLVRQGLRLELLETLEDEGIEGLKEWCVRKGIDLHFPCPKPAPWADFGGVEVYEVIA